MGLLLRETEIEKGKDKERKREERNGKCERVVGAGYKDSC